MEIVLVILVVGAMFTPVLPVIGAGGRVIVGSYI